MRRMHVVAGVAVLSWATSARAQSASSCSFDPAAAAVTVSVNGRVAHLRAVGSTGAIELNGVPCGAATVTNTDSVQVNGGALQDTVSLTGRFAPGLTPEPAGKSAIAIGFALGDAADTVIVKLSGGNNRIRFTSDGIDRDNDGDRDILTAGSEAIVVDAGDGDDRVDATAYTSTSPLGFVRVQLYGGNGRDTLSAPNLFQNDLYGGADDDTLYGGASRDWLYGGAGNDLMLAGGGNDYLFQETIADGADDMRGGDGQDQVVYADRVNPVTVTIGDDQPDGEPGEGDLVRGDVETVIGGRGGDVLVGNDGPNGLFGQGGDDELYGGGGNDRLDGLGGDDSLVGDDGDDVCNGGGGNDVLDGGAGDDDLDGYLGRDTLYGGPGADHLTGGGGVDELHGDDGDDLLINNDGLAETVDCGAGAADDAEPDPLDTFIGCEL